MKRLKILHVSVQWTKGIILSDSIESLYLVFLGVEERYDYSNPGYSKYFNQEFELRLPKAANVKYLYIYIGFDCFNVEYFGNLKDFFPKLKKFLNHTSLEIAPKGFLLAQDESELPEFFDSDIKSDY